MKFGRTLGVIVGIAAILLTAAAAISCLLYRASVSKAHDEKWKDYIDCGVS